MVDMVIFFARTFLPRKHPLAPPVQRLLRAIASTAGIATQTRPMVDLFGAGQAPGATATGRGSPPLRAEGWVSEGQGPG